MDSFREAIGAGPGCRLGQSSKVKLLERTAILSEAMPWHTL